MENFENEDNNLKPNDNICVICQDILDTSDEFNPIITLRCQHQFHTQCVLECAWRGRVACSICRSIPITNHNQEQQIENLDYDYHYHNTQQLQKFFVKGLRMFKNKSCPNNIKVTVRRYYRAKEQEKKNKKEIQEMLQIHKKMKQEILQEINLVRDKYLEYHKKKLINSLQISFYSKKSYYLRPNFKRLKKNIAIATGYVPLEI